MAERRIIISATTTNPKPLIIEDKFSGITTSNKDDDTTLTTNVQPYDIVRWVPEGDITSIFSIELESGSKNLFIEGPHKDAIDNSWAGVIFPNAQTDKEESYKITYIVNGEKYSQDPKIKINPNG